MDVSAVPLVNRVSQSRILTSTRGLPFRVADRCLEMRDRAIVKSRSDHLQAVPRGTRVVFTTDAPGFFSRYAMRFGGWYASSTLFKRSTADW